MSEQLFPEIHFNRTDLPLSEYEKLPWKLEETRIVEFFPQILFSVTLISTETPGFENYLNDISDQARSAQEIFSINKIALDLEWEDELCLFQFCFDKKVLLVRHPNGPGNSILHNFLSSHQFFAKGASNDKKQLKMKFGEEFQGNIEDIAQTRLVPYGYSENFMEMTYQFAGSPTTQFKDIRITTSNWSQKELTMRQVLYAAFDVVAIFQCYPHMPPPKQCLKPIKQRKQSKSPTKMHKKLNTKIPKTEKSGSDEKIKVIMKPNSTKQGYCYLITDFGESYNSSKLFQMFEQTTKSDQINFLSVYRNDSVSMIFISLFVDLDISDIQSIFNETVTVTHLPSVSPCDESDGDFIYLTDIPDRFSEKRNLELFLFNFEIDHRLSIIDNQPIKYAKIEVCSALSSYNLKCFIPFIQIDGITMKLYEFPLFLNQIQVGYFPSTFSEDDCMHFFSKYGQVTSVRKLLRRSDDDLTQFVVTYHNISGCESAISKMNYEQFEGNEILVSYFAEETQMRILRRYKLILMMKNDDDFISSKELYQLFSPFGQIFQASFVNRLKVAHVQFFNKSNAQRAFEFFNQGEFKNRFDIFFPAEASTIIIRDISYIMTQDSIIEMCEEYGQLVDFVVRLMIPKFRYQIVEVTYTNEEDALNAKKNLDNRRIDTLPIVVSVFRGAGAEVPMWKMEQRYQWVVINDNSIEETIVRPIFERFGLIIDYENINNETLMITNHLQNKKESTFKTFIMFNDSRSATAAIEFYNSTQLNDKEHKVDESVAFHDLRIPTLFEFACEIQRNKNFLQTGNFVPFKNTVNEAQQFAIVIDPLPQGFTEHLLQDLCPKCFYTLAVSRSEIDPIKRKAVLYVDGMKMTKKIFALIRGQRCTPNLDNNIFDSPTPSFDDDIINPIIKKREDVLKSGVVVGLDNSNVVHSPISIIIDPIPNELDSEKKIRTNILMGKEADIDILDSAMEPNRKMAVVLPRRKEDCKIILRTFRRWKVEGKPLNVKKIVNVDNFDE